MGPIDLARRLQFLGHHLQPDSAAQVHHHVCQGRFRLPFPS
ncbi:hypothetical protein V6U90_28965 [Micromonospora sp. CPCC 206060]